METFIEYFKETPWGTKAEIEYYDNNWNHIDKSKHTRSVMREYDQEGNLIRSCLAVK
jgi:hypothetical protein